MSDTVAAIIWLVCVISCVITGWALIRRDKLKTWDVVNRCQLAADIACHERDVARDNASKAEASREWYKTALEQTSAELERVRAELEKTKTDRDEWRQLFELMATPNTSKVPPRNLGYMDEHGNIWEGK